MNNNMLTLHSRKCEFFETNETNIESKKKELEKMKLIKIKDNKIKYKIKTLNDEIFEYEKNIKEKTNYFLNAYDLIEKYHDMDKNQVKTKINIINFFNTNSNKNTNTNTLSNKKRLLDEYVYITDNFNSTSFNNNSSVIICEKCNIEMILSKKSDFMICIECGQLENNLIECGMNKNLLNDSYGKSSIYQRKNHFKEWLNQLQARETIEIEQDVVDKIILELKNNNITNLANIEITLIKKILKKLHLSKYYENAFHIIYLINGLQPPILTIHIENKLIEYFKMIEEPFKMYKKKERKNILRYSYILYKLCELLELDQFLSCFSLLKNRTKLMEQDQIWKMICNHLNWEFIPSI